jgi:hypothetical protein
MFLFFDVRLEFFQGRLIEELRNCHLRQVAMCLVANQPHREEVAQSRRDPMWILADEPFQPRCEIMIWSFVIHRVQ